MIVIVPYQPAWPSEFAAIAARIRSTAGDGIVALHHIGSTAVPGLAAKDIIDVQITVADIDAADRLPLAAAGFTLGAPRTDHCPPGMTLAPEQLEKRFYKIDNGDARVANIHVRVRGRFNHSYPLLCRDYLRAHPAAAAAYGEIKRQLARLHPDDEDAYYDVKDPVFDIIMEGARDWAEHIRWSVPPSD